MAPASTRTRAKSKKPLGLPRVNRDTQAAPASKRRKQQERSVQEDNEEESTARVSPSPPFPEIPTVLRRRNGIPNSVATPPPPRVQRSILQDSPEITESGDVMYCLPVQHRPISQVMGPFSNVVVTSPSNAGKRMESDGADFETQQGYQESLPRRNKQNRDGEELPTNYGERDDGRPRTLQRLLISEQQDPLPSRTPYRNFALSDGEDAVGTIAGHQPGQAPILTDIGSLLKQLYCNLRDELRTRLFETSKEIGDRMSVVESELRDLTLQVEELRVLTNSQGSGALKKSTPWQLFKKKLNVLTPHCDWVFNEDVFARVSQSYFPHFFSLCANESGRVLEGFCEAFRAMILSVLPKKTRQIYSTSVGKKHSRMKYSLVLSALLNVQENRFNKFKSSLQGDGIGDASPCTPTSSISAGIGSGSGRSAQEGRAFCTDVDQIVQQAWLRRGFITKGHVCLARSREETAVATLDGNDSGDEAEQAQGREKQKWLIVKERPNDRDVALFGALKVYRKITASLHDGREKGRICFFEELGYLMVGCKDMVSFIDQRNVMMKWAFPEFVRDESLSSVPDTKHSSSGATMALKHNSKAFSELLALRKDMVLSVSHPVQLRPAGTSSRRRRNGELRTLQKATNLLDVAAKFLVAFTQQSQSDLSTHHVLGAHPEALRSVFSISCVLRDMVDLFIEENTVEGRFIPSDSDLGDEIHCHDLKLGCILPTPIVQARLLGNRCLKMTEDTFEVLHVEGERGIGDGVRNESALEDREIMPSSEDSIVLM